jgi:hypothetical protein
VLRRLVLVLVASACRKFANDSGLCRWHGRKSLEGEANPTPEYADATLLSFADGPPPTVTTVLGGMVAVLKDEPKRLA